MPLFFNSLFFKPAISFLKNAFLVIVVFFIVISLFSYFINKDKISLTSQTNPIQENRTEIYKIVNDKELGKTQQGKLTIVFYRGMTCSMIGEACSNNPQDGDKNFNKSFLGFVNNLIVTPFLNPPASGVYWAYSGLQNAGFIPKTLAAEGIGMGSIQPFAKIWKIFRDVAYLLLVVILIAIGFMVMFRTKINPQTVISVENSLPRIIFSLILITFSFAIAGFMIDLMYVLIAVIISILGPVYKFGGGGPNNVADLQKYYLTAGLGAVYEGTGKLNSNMWGTVFWSLPETILGLIPALGWMTRIVGGSILTYMSLPLINFIHGLIDKGFKPVSEAEPKAEVGAGVANVALSTKLKGIVDPFVAGGIWVFTLLLFGILISAGMNILLGLVIWFSLVFVVFRIIFMLLSSYIKILFSIILSPFYLIFEAIPGQSAFTNWIKNLAGELITFPLIVGIFVLGAIISDSASSGNLVSFPFMVGIDSKSFGYMVGLAILFMTPDLVMAVRQVFIPKPGIFDKAGPGVFFGGASTGISGGLGELSKVAGIGFYIKPVRDLLQKLPGGKQIFADNQGQQHQPLKVS